MAESSISLVRSDILSHLGQKLGWSADTTNWDSAQTARANLIVESGERTFYGAHDWSFCDVLMRLPIVSGKDAYDLPDGFHFFVDTHLTFDQGDNKYCYVTLTSMGELLKAKQSPITTSSQPELAAEEWLPADGTKPQRKGLNLWPTPTDAGTLNGLYRFHAHGLTSSAVYPLGGSASGQALLAAVLAAAELHNQEEDMTWRNEYQTQLALAIKMDNDASCPKYFGRMRGSARGGSSMRPSNHYVTYAGNLYLGAD
jgi:hypothetical protein